MRRYRRKTEASLISEVYDRHFELPQEEIFRHKLNEIDMNNRKYFGRTRRDDE